MRKYEGVFIFRTDIEDAVREDVFAKLKEVIENGGKIEEIAEWGARKLAYEIDYQKEGFYYVVSFEGTPEIVFELERRSRISDSILRYMVTRANA